MGQKLRIGYCRVSTATGEQAAALINQRSRVEASGVAEIIEDIESGLSQERKGYVELLRRIATKSISEIVVTRLDRLGRDAAATDAFIAVAAKHKVAITCLDGGTVEAQSPQGFLLARIATSMAEVESRMLSMRVKAGYAEGRKKARPLRGRAAWGYAKNADNSALIPDAVEWSRAQQFVALLQEVHMRTNTALDEWHKRELGPIPLNSCRAVRAWLLNPTIRGGLGYNQLPNHCYETLIWDTHPALITHTQFDAFERQLKDNARRWGHVANVTPRLLTGLCVCAGCGRKMTYAGSRRIASVICKSRECEQRYKSTHEDVVRAAINQALSERAADVAARVHQQNPEELQLLNQISELEAKGDPDLQPAIDLKRERLRALAQKQGPDPQLLAAFSDPAVFDHFQSFEELRQVYLSFVQQVDIRMQVVEAVVLRL
jgi:DNA invertase Pin-like site-specific DNA recombinase